MCIQNLPVRFAIDRAGLVGADGATHAGSFDVTYLATLPNMVVMAAADEAELVHMNLYRGGARYPARLPSAIRAAAAPGFPCPTFRRSWKSARAGWCAKAPRSRSCRLGPRSGRSAEGSRSVGGQGAFDHGSPDMRFAKPLDEETDRPLDGARMKWW